MKSANVKFRLVYTRVRHLEQKDGHMFSYLNIETDSKKDWYLTRRFSDNCDQVPLKWQPQGLKNEVNNRSSINGHSRLAPKASQFLNIPTFKCPTLKQK